MLKMGLRILPSAPWMAFHSFRSRSFIPNLIRNSITGRKGRHPNLLSFIPSTPPLLPIVFAHHFPNINKYPMLKGKQKRQNTKRYSTSLTGFRAPKYKKPKPTPSPMTCGALSSRKRPSGERKENVLRDSS
ncbi:hypothetical protein VTL71DRAFT_9148 [Oculimacula yallundae]|uniref:Ribosomal protein S18 n=1 Tax=Oculimacula yallundae TaxID=86028 RepID=A0ABR4BVG0_9HELO